MIYYNGDTYEGEWISDQKRNLKKKKYIIDGKGKYFHGLTNDTYEGEWVNDRKHGLGTYTFA